jgi:hypothetical protein
MKKHTLFFSVSFLVTIFCFNQTLFAQDIDLFKMQDEQNKKEGKEKTDIVTATFKTTRMINGQSIENVGRGIMDLKISHRFGTVNTGPYNFFGLDQATMRIGMDYGITDRLMFGFGRSTYNKEFDGFFKYKILRQSTGKRNIPISISYAPTVIWQSLKDPVTNHSVYYTDHFYFAHQLIIARKFNEYFSLQLVPTLVHYNIVPLARNPNDLYSLGIGFRQRISKRVNLTGEYYYQFNQFDGYYNSFSLGFDIETGGHVFQLHFTNSTGINEKSFITQTDGQWGKGDIHFGFNISRVFTIVKPKVLTNLK